MRSYPFSSSVTGSPRAARRGERLRRVPGRPAREDRLLGVRRRRGPAADRAHGVLGAVDDRDRDGAGGLHRGRARGQLAGDRGRARQQTGPLGGHAQGHGAAVGEAGDVDALGVGLFGADQVLDQRLGEPDVEAGVRALRGLLRAGAPAAVDALGIGDQHAARPGGLLQPALLAQFGGVGAAAVEGDDEGPGALGGGGTVQEVLAGAAVHPQFGADVRRGGGGTAGPGRGARRRRRVRLPGPGGAAGQRDDEGEGEGAGPPAGAEREVTEGSHAPSRATLAAPVQDSYRCRFDQSPI